MDRTDLRILETLQGDGRLSNIELAEKVSLSASPCLRRVRALEEAGIIAGYAALLDPEKLGLGSRCIWMWRSTSAMPKHAIGSRRRCKPGVR